MADREKSENKFLNKLMRKAGKGLMTLGAVAGMAGAAAFGIGIGIPALFAALGGAPIVPLLAKLSVAIPYLAGVAATAGTGLFGGYALLRAGGQKFDEQGFPVSSEEPVTRPLASNLSKRSARRSFNTNADDMGVTTSVLAAAAVVTLSHHSM